MQHLAAYAIAINLAHFPFYSVFLAAAGPALVGAILIYESVIVQLLHLRRISASSQSTEINSRYVSQSAAGWTEPTTVEIFCNRYVPCSCCCGYMVISSSSKQDEEEDEEINKVLAR